MNSGHLSGEIGQYLSSLSPLRRFAASQVQTCRSVSNASPWTASSILRILRSCDMGPTVWHWNTKKSRIDSVDQAFLGRHMEFHGISRNVTPRFSMWSEWNAVGGCSGLCQRHRQAKRREYRQPSGSLRIKRIKCSRLLCRSKEIR